MLTDALLLTRTTDPAAFVRMMTIALAIVIPLSMLIHSNSRITEAKETLRAEMALLVWT